MAIPLRERETRRAAWEGGRAADGPAGIDELILDKFKTVPPGRDTGLIGVWAQLRRVGVRLVRALLLWDSVPATDVQVDIMRLERSFHHLFSLRIRCEVPIRINHVVELNENILVANLWGIVGIVGIEETDRLAGPDVRVSFVHLPDLQDSILIVVMNRCADDHCCP